MQLDPIKPELKPHLVLALETKMWLIAFKRCFQIQLAPLRGGEAVSARGAGCADGRHAVRGRPVQVDPIKLKLKPPVSKSLKLKYGKMLSNVAFKFNLRRYNEASCEH